MEELSEKLRDIGNSVTSTSYLKTFTLKKKEIYWIKVREDDSDSRARPLRSPCKGPC